MQIISKKLKFTFLISFTVSFVLIITGLYIFYNPFSIDRVLKNNTYTEYKHIKIYNLSDDDIQQVIEKEIKTLDDELLHFIGPITPQNLNIIIYENYAEFQKQSNSEYMGAFYDHRTNAIALYSKEEHINVDEQTFINYLRHEYTHYYLSSYLKTEPSSVIPKWFEEGLANYVASSLKGESANIPKELVDFTLLKTRKDWEKYMKKSYELYVQSHFAIKYIAQKNGLNVIKNIIDESIEIGFNKAFYKNTRIHVKDLHNKINLHGITPIS